MASFGFMHSSLESRIKSLILELMITIVNFPLGTWRRLLLWIGVAHAIYSIETIKCSPRTTWARRKNRPFISMQFKKPKQKKRNTNEINFISISLVTNFTFCSMKSRKKLNIFFEEMIMLYTLHQTHFLAPTNTFNRISITYC